ncbi:MAG: MlaD family protein [Spirochaetes bacterium]|jgi:phospholipid/cholesterol/gamma-HCH transport system substrate-binding protein|nr:MlaD family protein [Spirochaetota bacterium]
MKITTEAKVGMMITFSFTLFIVIVALLAQFNINRSGYHLRLYFSFLNDLKTGAAVKIGGGIQIGQVVEINQSQDKTVVKIWIDNEYKLSKSTSFAIFTTGVIGEKYVNVIVPAVTDNSGYLQDGDIKYGIDPASFDRMMQTFQSFLQDRDGGEILADIFMNSSKFVENMNEIVEDNKYDVKSSVVMAKSTIENLNVQTRELMYNVNKLAKNMSDISTDNKADIDSTLKNLSQTTTSLNKLVYRLENGRGTIGRLMYDEEIYNNLRDASIYARDLFYDLKQDPSKLFFKSSR